MIPTSPPSPDVSSSGAPNRLYDPGPARIEGMPEILQLETLDRLVGIYDDMVASDSYATDTGPDLVRIEERIAEVKKKLLKDAGFVVEETGRTEDQTSELEFADDILDGAIRANKSDWIGHTTTDGGHNGLRNEVFREMLGEYYKPRRAVEDEPPLPEQEITQEEEKVLERLNSARNEYARLTARDRKSFIGRFLRGDSWMTELLLKIPKVDSLRDAINDQLGDVEMKKAIAEFETATKDAMRIAEERLVESGLSPESFEFKQAKIALHIDADNALEDKIVEERHSQSKKAGKFTNWWVKQNKFVKGATIIGTGLAVGAVSGAVTAVVGIASIAGIAGGIAGGATGFGMARSITSRRANAITEKDGKYTVAEQKSRHDREAKSRFILGGMGDTDRAIADMVNATERSTSKEMLRNRRRLKTLTGLGFSAGALAGGFTGGELSKLFAESAKRGSSEVQLPTGGETGGEVSSEVQLPTGGETGGGGPEINLNNTFNVENGSGFIKEWDQWASANGHPIDRETATQLHRAVHEEFGGNGIIDISGVKKSLETYMENGDLRIGRPGEAKWRDGVAEFAQKWLAERGKW